MLDRALKLVVTLTLLLFLLQAVVGVLSRMLEVALTEVVSAMGHTGSLLGGMLVAIGVVFFAAGLLIRLFRLITTRDPRAARERASRERAMRQRVRHPAEGVPPHHIRHEPITDVDPAVDDDEEGR